MERPSKVRPFKKNGIARAVDHFQSQYSYDLMLWRKNFSRIYKSLLKGNILNKHKTLENEIIFYQLRGWVWIPSLSKIFFGQKLESFFFICSNVATMWLFVRKPLFIVVKLFFSSRTRQFLSERSSPLCSIRCLMRPLLLKVNMSKAASQQQYVLLETYVSLQLMSSSKSPGSLFSCFLCACHSTLGLKKFPEASALKLPLLAFDYNRFHSVFISGWIQYSSSFSATARYSESLSISNSSNLFTS